MKRLPFLISLILCVTYLVWKYLEYKGIVTIIPYICDIILFMAIFLPMYEINYWAFKKITKSK